MFNDSSIPIVYENICLHFQTEKLIKILKLLALYLDTKKFVLKCLNYRIIISHMDQCVYVCFETKKTLPRIER